MLFVHHWWLPLVSGIVWICLLVSMLIWWGVQGRPILPSMEGQVPFISDIGATWPFKVVFIVCSSVTGAFFTLSLAAERYLRHAGRLALDNRRREKVLAALAMFFALTGSVGLILLSVFDTQNHPTMHRGFLLMFIASIVLSAIFTLAEYWWIRKDYNGIRRLRRSYVYKFVVILFAFGCAIAFGVLIRYSYHNPAGVMEWVVAGFFGLYIFTFVYDLRPAAKTRKPIYREEHALEHGVNHNLGNSMGHF